MRRDPDVDEQTARRDPDGDEQTARLLGSVYSFW